MHGIRWAWTPTIECRAVYTLAGASHLPVSTESRLVRTIAIINQKGGCGKTTTAINLAGVFSRSGLRTLLVDLDPQSHCAAGLAIPEQRIDVNIGDAMIAPDDKRIDWTRLLWRISRNLDLAPSTVRLAGLESTRGGLATLQSPERRLLSVLSRLADQYDICLIDCPPSIGLLTYNALVASGEVLIPVETAFFSLQGAGKQVSTIKAVGKRLGVSPPFRMLATMHNPDSPLSRDLLDELRRRFEGKVVPGVIRFDQALREAVSFGQPIVEYAAHSTGAEDYLSLGRWLIENPCERSKRGNAADDLIDAITGESDSTPAPAQPPSNPAAVLASSAPSAVTVRANVSDVLLGSVRSSPATLDGAPDLTVDAVLSRAAELAARTQRLGNRPSALRVSDIEPPLPTLGELARQRAAYASQESALRSVYGVRVTSSGAIFVQPASIGRAVSIAAEFNNWSSTDHPMRLNDTLGVLEVCVPLPPGQHQYRLVVDGNWIPDPHNPSVMQNPFGEPNSFVDVPMSPTLAGQRGL